MKGKYQTERKKKNTVIISLLSHQVFPQLCLIVEAKIVTVPEVVLDVHRRENNLSGRIKEHTEM